MALPKLTTPTYELEIPSTDEKIKYRPFLVKEEKILMMAMESKSDADITQAVKDIVSECTFNKVNISNMPMFDVEYIFLQIRSKSVGEVSKLKLLCPDDKRSEEHTSELQSRLHLVCRLLLEENNRTPVTATSRSLSSACKQ